MVNQVVKTAWTPPLALTMHFSFYVWGALRFIGDRQYLIILWFVYFDTLSYGISDLNFRQKDTTFDTKIET